MKNKMLTANMLKIVAVAAMTLDHITWTLFPGYDQRTAILILHGIGRITMPIMCYFIAEGYYHTRNLKRYMGRLFIFSVISHFAYTFAFGISFIPFKTGIFNQTSVIWAMFWGLFALAAVKIDDGRLKPWMKNLFVILAAAAAFPADWSSIAVLMIVYFGINRGNFVRKMFWMIFWVLIYSFVYCMFIDTVYGILQMYVILAVPLLYFYNGERGGFKCMKWFFYFYYPAHLAVCGIIRILI